MTTVTQVRQAMQRVFQQYSQHLGQRLIQRERDITARQLVQGLVFGFVGNPQASLSELSQSCANVGATITRQAVHQRFTADTAELLRQLVNISLQQVIEAAPPPSELLQRFNGIYVLDSTQIELPVELAHVWRGAGGQAQPEGSAALKLNVKWNLQSGQLCEVEMQAGTDHDASADIQHAPMPAGGLRIADLGYFSLDVLQQIDADDAYWLTRYKTGTRLYQRNGEALDLASVLPQQVGQTLDLPVCLGAQARLPCRLIAERVPDKVVQQRHERLQETARRRQEPIRQDAWQLAYWNLYLTNAPDRLLDVSACLLLGAYRWQIELLFKQWKSDLDLASWRSDKPWRILCEIYAKLLGAILQQWLLVLGCWSQPDRSLWQAARSVSRYAWSLAKMLDRPTVLESLIEAVCDTMAVCCMETRQARPHSLRRFADYDA